MLYRSGEPSSLETWSPAATATATGAHESHSYCPPEWAYTSTSPRTTAIAFTPAEPIGTSSVPSFATSLSTQAGGRVRETDSRMGPDARGASVGGSPVANKRPSAGNATAPTAATPATAKATCTAQSNRGGSPYSLLPSNGSMIQTRSRSSRMGSSTLSSDRTASSGRSSDNLERSNSLDFRSPADPPSSRICSKSEPASRARPAASVSSSTYVAFATGCRMPRLRRFSITSSADTAGDTVPLASMRRSGFSGTSYGESIPVKFTRSPRRALA